MDCHLHEGGVRRPNEVLGRGQQVKIGDGGLDALDRVETALVLQRHAVTELLDEAGLDLLGVAGQEEGDDGRLLANGAHALGEPLHREGCRLGVAAGVGAYLHPHVGAPCESIGEGVAHALGNGGDGGQSAQFGAPGAHLRSGGQLHATGADLP